MNKFINIHLYSLTFLPIGFIIINMDNCAVLYFFNFFQTLKGKFFGLTAPKNQIIMTRREAREAVFSLLFETEFRKDETVEEIYYSSVENREIEADEFIKRAYFTISEKIEEIDAKIGEHANGWKTQRLTNVSRSVLRLCVYEMLYEDTIPYNVSINEAVEIAKKYDEEKARPFINGVLDSVKKDLEAKGITK